MAHSTLVRLSGLALVLAFPIQVIGFLLHPPGEEVASVLQSAYGQAHMILFVSWILVMLGLPGLYAAQAPRAGKIGLAAFALLMLATVYHLYLLLYEAFATPLLAKLAPELIGDGPLAHGVGALAMLAGPLLLAFLLFGIATVRAGVLPRWSGWIQVVSLLAFLPVLFIDLTVFDGPLAVVEPIRVMYYALFLGYAGGGYAMWRQHGRERVPGSAAVVSQPAA